MATLTGRTISTLTGTVPLLGLLLTRARRVLLLLLLRGPLVWILLIRLIHLDLSYGPAEHLVRVRSTGPIHRMADRQGVGCLQQKAFNGTLILLHLCR